MEHEKFHYRNIEELIGQEELLGIRLPLSKDCGIMFEPVEKHGIRLENRFVIQPMEGCDGNTDGTPGPLTERRYDRFARSGAGLIWFEAVALFPEGRAKPAQLMLNERNADAFRRLLERVREISFRENGFAPKIIIQMAHSGRYSNPNGYPEPIIAYNNPIFEKDKPIDASRIISDDRLKEIEERFSEAAALAKRIGFDGADVKCCHRYLLSEFMSAYTRPGPYGGSFENRSRLYLNCVEGAIASASRDFTVTSRLNVYDGFPYPYGFGVNEESGLTPDLSEPLKLVDILNRRFNMGLINITIGNPYVNPHVNRPYDKGNYIPGEHPLEGVNRLMTCVSEVQKNNPDMIVIGSGFSYLRQLSVNLAAGMVEKGLCTAAGFGRTAFAYPDFIRDLKEEGALSPQKCCITCGECAKLLRAGQNAGCVIRDGKCYSPYKE